tara:strand:- start:102 stop:272 length:171 start_codon:yes stop_codon:yes gene_type:complete
VRREAIMNCYYRTVQEVPEFEVGPLHHVVHLAVNIQRFHLDRSSDQRDSDGQAKTD